MPRTKTQDGLSKFQHYRKSQKENGMKLLRIWVPDTQAPGFKAEARRQARLLRGKMEEKETLAFIESVYDWPHE